MWKNITAAGQTWDVTVTFWHYLSTPDSAFMQTIDTIIERSTKPPTQLFDRLDLFTSGMEILYAMGAGEGECIWPRALFLVALDPLEEVTGWGWVATTGPVGSLYIKTKRLNVYGSFILGRPGLYILVLPGFPVQANQEVTTGKRFDSYVHSFVKNLTLVPRASP